MKSIFINNTKYQLLKKYKSSASSRSFCATRDLSGIKQKVFLKIVPLTTISKTVYRDLLELRNEHLVRIYEFWENGNDFYIVQEWVDGLTLNDVCSLLKNQGEPFFEQHEKLILNWIYEVSLAIEVLQKGRQPLVHNDLSPQNIMIRKNDFTAILVDFDHCRPVGSHSQNLVNPVFSKQDQKGPFKTLHLQSDIENLGLVFLKMMESITKYPSERLSHICELAINAKSDFNAKELRKTVENVLITTSSDILSRPQLLKFRWDLLAPLWPVDLPIISPTPATKHNWEKMFSYLRWVSYFGAAVITPYHPVGSFEAIPIAARVVPWGNVGVKNERGEWLRAPTSGRHFIWHLKPGPVFIESSHPLLGVKILKAFIIPDNPQVFTIFYNQENHEMRNDPN